MSGHLGRALDVRRAKKTKNSLAPPHSLALTLSKTRQSIEHQSKHLTQAISRCVKERAHLG